MATDLPVQALITSNLTLVRETIIAFLPKIGIAIGLIIAGWIIAKCISYLINKLITAIDKLLSKIDFYGKNSKLRQSKKNITRIFANLSFWLVFVFFIVLAIQSLGITQLSASMKKITHFMPNIIACALIILFGYVISQIVRESVVELTDIGNNKFISSIISGVIIFIAIILGIQQLAINISFLVRLFNMTYGVAIAGIALCAALSTYRVLADLMIMKMITQHLKIGQNIHVGGISGTISAMNSTSITLTGMVDGKEVVTLLPIKHLRENPMEITTL